MNVKYDVRIVRRSGQMQKTVSAAQKAKKPKPQKPKVIKAQDPHLPKPLQTLNLEPNFYALMTRIRLSGIFELFKLLHDRTVSGTFRK